LALVRRDDVEVGRKRSALYDGFGQVDGLAVERFRQLDPDVERGFACRRLRKNVVEQNEVERGFVAVFGRVVGVKGAFDLANPTIDGDRLHGGYFFVLAGRRGQRECAGQAEHEDFSHKLNLG